MRFALSQKPVATGIPPSFLDLLDRTIEAAKKYEPLDTVAVSQLKEMAATRDSIFTREETIATQNAALPYPANPRDVYLA